MAEALLKRMEYAVKMRGGFHFSSGLWHLFDIWDLQHDRKNVVGRAERHPPIEGMPTPAIEQRASDE